MYAETTINQSTQNSCSTRRWPGGGQTIGITDRDWKDMVRKALVENFSFESRFSLPLLSLTNMKSSMEIRCHSKL